MQRKVIGYARVNANAEHELDCQITQLEGAGVMEVLSDIESGMSKDRAGLNHLFALIEADQVKEVVVTSVDRLSRSPVRLHQFLNVCRGKAVVIKVLSWNVPLS